jgi:hypothetical protein
MKMMIMSTFLATCTLLSSTVSVFAMTGGTNVNTDHSAETVNTSPSAQLGSNSNDGSNQAQQLQNLYLQKLQFDPKLLDSSNLLDLIVQFDVDPAPIQMLNQQKNGSSAGGNQKSTSDVTLVSAEKAVNQTHSNFKSFVTNESKALKDAGVTNSIKIGREYTQVFNGLAVKMSTRALNDMLALPYVKSVYLNVKYAPIPASQLIDGPASVTGDGKVSTKQTNPNLLSVIRTNRSSV